MSLADTRQNSPFGALGAAWGGESASQGSRPGRCTGPAVTVVPRGRPVACCGGRSIHLLRTFAAMRTSSCALLKIRLGHGGSAVQLEMPAVLCSHVGRRSGSAVFCRASKPPRRTLSLLAQTAPPRTLCWAVLLHARPGNSSAGRAFAACSAAEASSRLRLGGVWMHSLLELKGFCTAEDRLCHLRESVRPRSRMLYTSLCLVLRATDLELKGSRMRCSDSPPMYCGVRSGAGICLAEFGGGAVGRCTGAAAEGCRPAGPSLATLRALIAYANTLLTRLCRSRRQVLCSGIVCCVAIALCRGTGHSYPNCARQGFWVYTCSCFAISPQIDFATAIFSSSVRRGIVDRDTRKD